MSARIRKYMYVSLPRVDEAYGQSATRSARAFARWRGGGISVVGTGPTVNLDRSEQRFELQRELQHVREHLNDTGQLGTLDEPQEYFYGRISMFYAAFDNVNPAVLYLVGETERTVVALGGPLMHVVGRNEASAKSREGARMVISEREVTRAVAHAQRERHRNANESPTPPPQTERWELDVVETYTRFGDYPQEIPKTDVEILAWREEFSHASSLADWLPHPKNVLLGRPIFVAYA